MTRRNLRSVFIAGCVTFMVVFFIITRMPYSDAPTMSSSNVSYVNKKCYFPEELSKVGVSVRDGVLYSGSTQTTGPPEPVVNRAELIANWAVTYSNEKEMFNFVRRKSFNKSIHYRPPGFKVVNDESDSLVYNDIEQLHLFQLHTLEKQREAISDGVTWQQLKYYVEKVIDANQNPKDCKNAKIAMCSLSKACGFACQMHHAIYCLTVALAEGRVLLFHPYSWRSFSSPYKVFMPTSTTCDSKSTKNNDVVSLPIIESSNDGRLPTTVPTQILANISTFHTNPYMWWIGQLSRFIFRFQSSVIDAIRMKGIDIKSPTVGIHVRRTDKIGTEAMLYELDEYMYWVKLYFSKLEIAGYVPEKCIYLATDESGLLNTAVELYPEYTFINSGKTQGSNAGKSREDIGETYAIISDVYHLSLTDYLICTFSSQVCRLAYELMNSRHEDASYRFQSLDEIYYFGGQLQRDFEVVIPHSRRYKGEVEINPGEKLNLRHNDWSGYSYIEKLPRSKNGSGYVPSYKVREFPLRRPFAAFDNYEASVNARKEN